MLADRKKTAWIKRIAKDVAALKAGGLPVVLEKEDDLSSFRTLVSGPKDTPYEGCLWQVRFTIPSGFPFQSPSVGFVERILHPNVDEPSGSICLDTLNKAWSAAFTIKHIVETVLPYLLSYPNPDDPLNRDAAYLMKTNPEGFRLRARAHALENCHSRAA